MNRILGKRIFRDLRANFARYLALMLMIMVGMFIVVSLVGAAETIISGTERLAKDNMVEDGQFSVFLRLTAEQEKELTDCGIILERMFSADIKTPDGSTLRIMRVRDSINLIQLDEGVLPSDEGEAVLEKRYAEEHGVSVGDTIEAGGCRLSVTGIGTVPDYDMPIAKFSDSAVESGIFGLVFVADEQYTRILTDCDIVEDYCYAYRLNGKLGPDELRTKIESMEFDYSDVDDVYFREMVDSVIGGKEEIKEHLGSLSDCADKLVSGLEAAGIAQVELYDGASQLFSGATRLEEETGRILDELFVFEINNLTSFIKAEDNPRILAAAKDTTMQKNVGLMAGVIVMIMFAYVISVFTVHQIQRESSVIGTLYALGAKRRQIIRHYITLPTVVSLLGGVMGSAAGFSKPGVQLQMAATCSYFSVPDLEPEVPLYLLIYAMVMPAVVSAAVNWFVISRRLSGTALSMIRNEQGVPRHSRLTLGNMGFIRRFQIRQILREARTGVTVMLGMFVCMLVFMLGLDCYVLCDNIRVDNAKDTKFEYMYNLKYSPESVPEGAEACYVESLSKTYMGYTLDVNVIGIDNDNKYYPARTVKGRSSVIVGSSTAQRYGLSVGDYLILSDRSGNIDYVFTVEGVADYSVGLTIFMDIDSMRELFGCDEDYYNMLLSDRELDIDGGRIYSVTTRADVERSAAVFVEHMREMFIMLISASVGIFCTVLFLMMKVMIDRSAFGISLIKIFGFRAKEVRKLYLDGNVLTVVIGTVISIPLSKLIVDAIFPGITANIACGLDLTFPWYLYAAIFAGVLFFYFIINRLLMGRLDSITPAEVLKHRE